MDGRKNLADTLSAMVRKLLQSYDERVSVRAAFPDLRVAENVQFGDPGTALPGRVELVVMHMDPEIDKTQDFMRFLTVRVMKSHEWGWCASTCLHGRKEELRSALEALAENPAFLVERIGELSDGLPEETDPNVWR